MNKRITGIIILIVFAGVLPSCKKNWLDAKSSISLVVPSTYTDFQALLDNSNINQNSVPGLDNVGADEYTVADADFQSGSDDFRNAYTWTHSGPYASGNTGWVDAYSDIEYCNVVLDGLGSLTPENSSNQQAWNYIKGQALFIRAFYFYNLAQIWTPPYISDSAAKNLSIPIRLSSDVNISSTHSTVQQTYNQILNDLLAAKDLLPANIHYQTRGSRPAVFALLARTSLVMQDFQNAFLYADSCLQLYNELLDYNTLDSTAYFRIPSLCAEIIFFNQELSLIGLYQMQIDTSIYHLYQPNDLRHSLYFAFNADSSIQFRGDYTGYGAFFAGIATDEIYLIRAECNARLGNTAAAMSDLNTLLQNRWAKGTFVPFSAGSANDALNQILIERRRELLLRGLRWPDLRRLNLDPSFAETLSRNALGISHTLQPNSFQYTFPIPDDIIQKTRLSQNPGW
jgi:hypothetical protein